MAMAVSHYSTDGFCFFARSPQPISGEPLVVYSVFSILALATHREYGARIGRSERGFR
jgi:hypothetical protein